MVDVSTPIAWPAEAAAMLSDRTSFAPALYDVNVGAATPPARHIIRFEVAFDNTIELAPPDIVVVPVVLTVVNAPVFAVDEPIAPAVSHLLPARYVVALFAVETLS